MEDIYKEIERLRADLLAMDQTIWSLTNKLDEILDQSIYKREKKVIGEIFSNHL